MRCRDALGADEDAHRVVKRDSANNVLWSTPLDGRLYRARPPDLLTDAARTYVTHEDGVTALDSASGAVLWHSPGPADRMLLSGDLLLATECSTGDSLGTSGRWVTARATATGHEVFRVELPLQEFDPEPIDEIAGLFLVQSALWPGPAGVALLIDREGRVRFRCDCRIIDAVRRAEDRLIFTGKRVVSLSAKDVVRWSVPIQYADWLTCGGLVPLTTGGVVAFHYCCIADSGVQVLCFDPSQGTVLWSTYCKALGVSHSAYQHEATVKQLDDQLRVTSRGSYGTFIETLDASTGRLVSREVLP